MEIILAHTVSGVRSSSRSCFLICVIISLLNHVKFATQGFPKFLMPFKWGTEFSLYSNPFASDKVPTYRSQHNSSVTDMSTGDKPKQIS
jgi:hypothetical protein